MFSFNKPASAGASTTNTNSMFGQNNNIGSNKGVGTGFSFGQTNNNKTGAGTGFSFGNQATQQTNDPTANKGLFGNKPAGSTNTGTGFSFGQQQPNAGSGGGLFGNTNTMAGSGSGAGGLLGANTNNTVGGGLFGSGSNNTGSVSGGGTTGGLFGPKPTDGPKSLFGQNNATSTGGGLFGGSGSTSNNAGNGGLFGSKPPGTSLFGGNTANSQSALGGGLFGSQQPQQQQQFQQQSALQAISQLPITPMTKVIDLPPQLRQEIEQLDQYIQRQAQISQHLKADTAEHKELILSVPRDIAYLSKTESLANQCLAQDLKKISSIRDTTDQSIAETQTFSMILQQLLTPGSKISSIELDKFFHHRTQVYQNRLDDYFRVLSDIESAVDGIDADIFGSYPNAIGSKDGNSSESLDIFAMKTGLNALVSTVIEEFKLFMDTAERIAELHQKVKEITA